MKTPRRDADPLPPPGEGNLEVDPWSLPPPEGGYETLDLEDGPAAPASPTEVAAASEPAPAPPAASATPRGVPAVSRAEEAPATPAGRARSRGRALAIGAAAAALVVAISAGLLLRGRSGDGPGTGVRVTVTQDAHEAPWNSAPPLAPVDPSYVERRRTGDAPARAVPATPPPSGATAPRAARAQAPEAPAEAPPQATEADVPPPPPPPVPIQEPSAPAPAAPPPAAAAAATPEIPLPPPPVLAQPRPAATRARAPVLQTRTCVDDALRIPRGLEGRLPPEVVVRVEVGADGTPGEVSVPGPIDSRLAGAVTTAVRTCRFTPGSAGDGRPAVVPTTMRIRFE
jgi:hypothetical protein